MKKIALLIIIVTSIIGCSFQKRKMLIGQWEFQAVQVKTETEIDTSQKNQMADFVDRLSLQTTDFNYKEDGTFETLKKKVIDEKGKFNIEGKILTLEYGEGKEVEYDDYEILLINDTALQLRNAKNMVLNYTKMKK